MEDYLTRFLQYIHQRNSGSAHTLDAYGRDIEQFFGFFGCRGIRFAGGCGPDRPDELHRFCFSVDEQGRMRQRRRSPARSVRCAPSITI
ncbi:MAG: hypothetical protein V8T10_00220 [Merdibacter sp.]